MFDAFYYLSVVGLFTILTDIAMCQRNEIMKMAVGIVASKENFPYLCTVVYKKEWVGACSILTSEVVIVSVSNLNKPLSNDKGEKKRYYNDLENISVFAGSIYMIPSRWVKNSIPGLQERKVMSFFVANNGDDLKEIKEIKRGQNDKNFDLDAILTLDVIGAAFNVAFLKVEPFRWTSTVRPLPLTMDASLVRSSTRTRIKILEDHPYSNSACKIAAWHYPTSRKVFHHVLYTPKAMCKRAYCNYNLNACLKFPLLDTHVCFKSAYWGEPCARDTGAALFCKFFGDGNIFAILTTAFNCGNENLPCVYTTMAPVLEVYESIWKKKYTPPVVP